MDALRPYISRILAPIITAFIMWLLNKGIDLGPDAAAHLTEYGTVGLLAVFALLNGVIHKTIDKRLNPGDAASSHIAHEERKESTVLKAKADVQSRSHP